MEIIAYPEAYERYLYEFHATRDYFECHELLEEHWKANPDDGFGEIWVGLIQLAVGSYHYRRGNTRGATLMLRQARLRLEPDHLRKLGIDAEKMLREVDELSGQLERGEVFADVNIPIADVRLAERLGHVAAANGLEWGTPSRGDDELVNRHTRRDRSDIIAARAAAAEAKRGKRA